MTEGLEGKLERLTRASMVMAGDIDQSIYSYRPPFRRAGISLRGTTRVLKTNFRNTVQIHTLAVITSEQFEFSEKGSVRISTLHSSKGLDFPVVLIYIPSLYRRPQYDDQEVDRLLRNLLYVGITRAMDNLNIFLVAGPSYEGAGPDDSGPVASTEDSRGAGTSDPILRDLMDSFSALSQEGPA